MTKALYYLDPYQKEFSATVISCNQVKDHYEIILNETLFYPEGGGQMADKGFLNDTEIYDVHNKDNEIVHYALTPIEEGTEVKGVIDFKRRFDFMQQHSGEHIVSGLICARYNCDNVGFHLGDEMVTIDYNAEMSMDDVIEIEKEANKYIQENHQIKITYPSEEELKTIPYRSKKELSGEIRIVEFENADICACCGTHVTYSGEIGIIKFVSCKNYKGGVRLELLCGNRAYQYLLKNWQENIAISQKLSAQYFETSEFVDKVINTSINQKQKINELLNEKHEAMAEKYQNYGDVLLVEEEMDSLTLKKLAEKIHLVNNGYVAVFSGTDGSYKYVIMDEENKIISALKEMNTALNGKGGGKNGFAQGSLNCTEEAIRRYFKELK